MKIVIIFKREFLVIGAAFLITVRDTITKFPTKINFLITVISQRD